jgi:hypothetical protein
VSRRELIGVWGNPHVFSVRSVVLSCVRKGKIYFDLVLYIHRVKSMMSPKNSIKILKMGFFNV